MQLSKPARLDKESLYLINTSPPSGVFIQSGPFSDKIRRRTGEKWGVVKSKESEKIPKAFDLMGGRVVSGGLL